MNGQRVFVSLHGSRIEAERQAQSLSEFWPGVYVIRETPYRAQTCALPPEQYVCDSRA